MTAPRSSDPEVLETLLRAVVRATRSGNSVAARTLARTLTTEYADDPRVWVALAGVSDSRSEQRAALEQALALDPTDARVQTALARLTGSAQVVTPVPVDTVAPSSPALAPVEAPEPSSQRRSFVPWLVLLLLLVVLLPTVGYAMMLAWPRATAPADSVATPTIVAILGGATSVQSTTSIAITPSETTSNVSTAALAESTATSSVAASQPSATTVTEAASSATVLAPGAVATLAGWHASLPRSDYALALDGAIGNIAPRGRFVLALVALANTEAQPRSVPADVFVLIDNRGRKYHAQPSLSSDYLTAYGRAQRGDLSMEDAIPPGGGFFSVPVVFDVPRDATGLRLSLGDGSVGGWPVGEAAPAATTP